VADCLLRYLNNRADGEPAFDIMSLKKYRSSFIITNIEMLEDIMPLNTDEKLDSLA